MPILLMLSWWYSQGWLWILQLTRKRLRAISQMFAVSVLIKTWFAPWKQIHTESTFQTFLRDKIDNGVSRIIGSMVRGTMLFCALLLSIFTLFLGVMSLAVWPFIPLLTLILPVLALSGVAL